jgi:hypothetical protein
MTNQAAKRIAILAVSISALSLVVASVVAAATGSAPAESTAGLDGDSITVPGEVASNVNQLAEFVGTDAAEAASSLRLVRKGVGATATDIYAFRNEHGRPCIVVPEWIGFCQPSSGTKPEGLDWSIGGGDPQTPSKFIATYTDEIVSVTLAIDGRAIPVSMANNVAYAEFSYASKEAVFTATRTNGQSGSMSLDLSG